LLFPSAGNAARMRTMFALYCTVIAVGLVLWIGVGLVID
jgi:hypothetical protein